MSLSSILAGLSASPDELDSPLVLWRLSDDYSCSCAACVYMFALAHLLGKINKRLLNSNTSSNENVAGCSRRLQDYTFVFFGPWRIGGSLR